MFLIMPARQLLGKTYRNLLSFLLGTGFLCSF